jgi:hypothetical protein
MGVATAVAEALGSWVVGLWPTIQLRVGQR